MHICLAGAKSFPPRIGGIEVFTYEIGRRLAADGVKVTVVVPKMAGESRTDLIEGVSVQRVRALHNRFLLKVSMTPGLFGAAVKAKPDILHANDPPSGVVSMTKAEWSASVMTVHGIGVVASEWPTPFRQGGKALQTIAVKGVTRTVTTDMATASILKRHRDDILVIPPGVDLNAFGRSGYPKPASLSDDKVNVLFVGRLTKGKGADLFLGSFSHMDPKVLASIKFTIIGDGPLRGLANAVNLPKETVSWLGEIPHDKIAQYFAHADLVVIPSRSEGVPISMLEAMSANVPVVSTAVGGIAAYFDDRHLTRIESPKPENVARAVEAAINDRQTTQRKAAAARDVVVSTFSWDTIARKYLGLYEEVLRL